MTITYKTGDLLNADEIAIAHGCNTHGYMGAGVARLVRDKYPEVYSAYKFECDGRSFHIGSALPVWAAPHTRLVYNLGTQRSPGPNATVWGIFLSFANLAEDTYVRGINAVAIPRIGCGIGGLQWPYVEAAIYEALNRTTNPDLSIVVYDLPESS